MEANTFLGALGCGCGMGAIVPPDTTTTTTTTDTTGDSGGGGKNWMDTIDKIFSWGNQAADIYKTTQNQPGGNQTTPTPIVPPNTGMSTFAKAGLIVGGAAVVGGLIYAVAKGKSKKKS